MPFSVQITFWVTALTVATLLKDVKGLSFSGCFTLAPDLKVPTNVEVLGWSDKSASSAISVRFCVNHCVDKRKKYAGIVAGSSSTKPACVCGTERAFTQLGVADHSQSQLPCTHSVWYMKTYVAYGDVSSQRVGCYREVDDANNLASSTHTWFDTWMMSPNFCIKYCDANGASFANLKKGNTCSCGISFAKHGRVDDSQCNKACAGSLGEKCGGDLANSVYSTTSLNELLRPGTSLRPNGFQVGQPVKVPKTQTLVKNLFDLQQAINNQVPNQDVQNVGNTLFQGQEQLQAIMDVKAPLEALGKSQGFGLSNSADTRRWLAFDFPAELQTFADVIKTAHSFIDVKVKTLINQVNRYSRLSAALKPAISETLNKLMNYVQNGLKITDVEQSVQVAQLMISASGNCLPLLTSKQSEMINNLESVSQSLIDGPRGTKKLIQYLKDPFAGSAITAVAPPNVDSKKWRDSIKEIETGWFTFLSTNGIQFGNLVLSPYQVCDGPSGGNCTMVDISFIDLVKRPGDNDAKKAASTFISGFKAAFEAFDWSIFYRKLDEISRDFRSIEQYLVQAGLSSAANVRKLQAPVTDYKFTRSCVTQLSDLLHRVCFSNSKPDDSKVTKITC